MKPHLLPLGYFSSRGQSVKNRRDCSHCCCIICWIFFISHLGSVYFKMLLPREQQLSLIFISVHILFKINDFSVHRMGLKLCVWEGWGCVCIKSTGKKDTPPTPFLFMLLVLSHCVHAGML